jgi:argininosuccinate lyase
MFFRSSGALAGSTIVLDRQSIARQLVCARQPERLDAVGDRDFACEFLFCLAIVGMHLSRLSEDLIAWSASEFGFVEFSDAFSTGSSLMPQKKNPDMAELTRAKTGRLYGNLMSILTTLKALRSSYNRDMGKIKRRFSIRSTPFAPRWNFSAMLPEIKFIASVWKRPQAIRNLLATDLAEYLVKSASREAHETVGKRRACREKITAQSSSSGTQKTFTIVRCDVAMCSTFCARSRHGGRSAHHHRERCRANRTLARAACGS